MFCKWCGGNLASSDTKCKRCGKEVPALSDCGGFYDLVPNAKKTTEGHPEPVVSPIKTENPPRKPEPPKEVAPQRSKKNGRKSFLGLTVLTVAGFALVLVMLFMMHSKVNKYSDEISGLRNDLRGISEKIDALEEAAQQEETLPPETTTPVLDEEPILSEQNILFTVKIAEQEGTQEISADFDLGEYSDMVATSSCFDGNTGMITTATYSLKNAEGCLKLDFIHENEFRTQNVTVIYEVDDTIFGLSEAPETCKWQYRFDAESDWEDLPEDAFTQTGKSGETGLSIRETALQELIDNNEGTLELRCEIYRTNTDDGSLTIVIEGIRFYDEENNEEQTVG